jgi:hypothetical protein
MDLDRLRPGDWLNVQDDLHAFIHGVGINAPEHDALTAIEDMGRIAITRAPRDHPMTVEEVRQLQMAARAFFDHLFPKDDRPVGAADLGSMTLTLHVYRMNEAVYIDALGELREVVLTTLALLLSRQGPAPIRRCPECQTIFYRVRKQQYCSPRCAKRASMRQWRQTEEGKAYERKRSRTRHLQHIQQTLGQHVKVNRQARSGKER